MVPIVTSIGTVTRGKLGQSAASVDSTSFSATSSRDSSSELATNTMLSASRTISRTARVDASTSRSHCTSCTWSPFGRCVVVTRVTP